ncbi:hypothetical protein NUACC26_043080 [Scytonema sp. NUACC26]
MAYCDFRLSEVIQTFELTVNETSGLFANIPEEECSDLLVTIFRENVMTTYLHGNNLIVLSPLPLVAKVLPSGLKATQ